MDGWEKKGFQIKCTACSEAGEYGYAASYIQILYSAICHDNPSLSTIFPNYSGRFHRLHNQRVPSIMFKYLSRHQTIHF